MNAQPENPAVTDALTRLRLATIGTSYEGKIYLVGGAIRDRVLGLPHGSDLDLVLEQDAVELARFLNNKGLSTHFPVLYPRFGTAMIHLSSLSGEGVDVELVTARAESYQPDSRKPTVIPGTLKQDIYRRDFTINTLAQNLHTDEMIDETGLGMQDLKAGIIRTPVDPIITFFDDPLRMLRAVRFASRFEFRIIGETWDAILAEAGRLKPPTISFERIRDEFVKIALLPGKRFRSGMELLLKSGLLEQFMPEMLTMVGCTQGNWHAHDVWNHTLLALESLRDSAPLEVRLGLLWHDIGKPPTRSVAEETGAIRFYGHAAEGAKITREIMIRLKFANDEIRLVTTLVEKHMRLGDYRPEWEDPTVKRLIRDTHGILELLFELTECDRSAVDIPEHLAADIDGLKVRIDHLKSAVTIHSPLDGLEIMQILGIGEGIHLKYAKEMLTNAVIDGKLAQEDKSNAEMLLREWWTTRSA